MIKLDCNCGASYTATVKVIEVGALYCFQCDSELVQSESCWTRICKQIKRYLGVS